MIRKFILILSFMSTSFILAAGLPFSMPAVAEFNDLIIVGTYNGIGEKKSDNLFGPPSQEAVFHVDEVLKGDLIDKNVVFRIIDFDTPIVKVVGEKYIVFSKYDKISNEYQVTVPFFEIKDEYKIHFLINISKSQKERFIFPEITISYKEFVKMIKNIGTIQKAEKKQDVQGENKISINDVFNTRMAGVNFEDTTPEGAILAMKNVFSLRNPEIRFVISFNDDKKYRYKFDYETTVKEVIDKICQISNLRYSISGNVITFEKK